MKTKMTQQQEEMFNRLFLFVPDMETRSDRVEMFAILKVLYKHLGVPDKMTLEDVETLVDELDEAVEKELSKVDLNEIRKNNL